MYPGKNAMISSHSEIRPLGEARPGAAAVELAMLLPLLLFCSLALFDFSRVAYAQVTLQNCARNGALYEFYAASNYSMPSTWSSFNSAVTADAFSLSNVTATRVTPTPPLTSNNYVTVTATATITPVTIAVLKGFPSIPSSITLSQTATMPFPASTSASSVP
jgi:Flp pilus assembly protein TadG